MKRVPLRPAARPAMRHEGGYQTATKPQKFMCDGGLYLVKFAQNKYGNGKGIFTEQVVALAGQLIGAQVPQVALVDVPREHAEELRAQRASLGLDFDPQPGIHHGSRWADGHTDQMGIAYEAENRERFGALQVLYTWIGGAGDHQFIYRAATPHEVLSF